MGAYSLGPPIFELASPVLSGYSLRAYSLGAYSVGASGQVTPKESHGQATLQGSPVQGHLSPCMYV